MGIDKNKILCCISLSWLSFYFYHYFCSIAIIYLVIVHTRCAYVPNILRLCTPQNECIPIDCTLASLICNTSNFVNGIKIGLNVKWLFEPTIISTSTFGSRVLIGIDRIPPANVRFDWNYINNRWWSIIQGQKARWRINHYKKVKEIEIECLIESQNEREMEIPDTQKPYSSWTCEIIIRKGKRNCKIALKSVYFCVTKSFYLRFSLYHFIYLYFYW